jgi:N-acetylglucosaminyldiphosphoundecaprenol N-acetyl-beta-D-mannosaminyltransferase
MKFLESNLGPERITVFGRRTNLVENRNFDDLVANFSAGQGVSAFFCNVHMLMLAEEDPVLAKAMDQADWVFADGAPIAWLQRRITGKQAMVIRGHEMTWAICNYAAAANEPIGFLGSTPVVMDKLVSNLRLQFHNLNVAYQHCPQFSAGEIRSSPEQLQAIADSQVKWLFVGLGCPKQEKWIARHGGDLNCNILGVGAAFDWLSGSIKIPPPWIEQIGLAWFYRLLHNPAQLWRRYLVYNSKFILRIAKHLASGKSFQ